jgi:hypothetical protein
MTEAKFSPDREGAVYIGWFKYKNKSHSVATVATSWSDARKKFKAMGGDITGLAENNKYEGFGG